MPVSPDTFRLAFFISGVAVMFSIESVRPLRPWTASHWKRLGFHGGLAFFNMLFIRFTIAVPLIHWAAVVRAHGWGLVPMLGLDGPPEVALSLIALDMADYWWHRINHVVPLLWRFHKVHHSDTAVDVTTSLRFHPGELFLSGLAKAVWIGVLGPSLWAFAFFETGISVAAQFHHSNIDFRDSIENALRRVVMTPRVHTSHHTVTLRTRNANYATIFSGWDRLFGSFQEPDPIESKTLGLPLGREVDLSPVVFLRAPLTGDY